MPAERIAMRQVRDVLRLNAAGVSGNEIARRVGVASSTVRLTLKRLAAAGLGWPLPAEMTDAVLEAQLFTAAGKKQGHRRRAEPDWAAVHRELKRKHVTLQILWDEYIERHPDGYRYSRFCELYRGWASRISVTMRQTHAGGDKLFVDYAGDTVPVRDRQVRSIGSASSAANLDRRVVEAGAFGEVGPQIRGREPNRLPVRLVDNHAPFSLATTPGGTLSVPRAAGRPRRGHSTPGSRCRARGSACAASSGFISNAGALREPARPPRLRISRLSEAGEISIKG